MATVKSITIQDFKGIKDVTLRFGWKGAPPVTTLIGLNEGGKTKILEGLSHSVTGDSAVSDFNGEVSVSAIKELTAEDFKRASAIAEKQGYELEQESFGRTTQIGQSHCIV